MRYLNNRQHHIFSSIVKQSNNTKYTNIAIYIMQIKHLLLQYILPYQILVSFWEVSQSSWAALLTVKYINEGYLSFSVC